METPGTSLLASSKDKPFPRLLVVGLNPALQKVLDFDTPIEKNGVNRAKSVWTGVGGKGQQCARAAARFRNGSVTLAQFLGGDTGRKVEKMLDSSPGAIVQLTQWVSSPRRTCTTLCDPDGTATEIVEPSGEVTPKEYKALLAKVKKQLQSGVDGVVIAGTYPPGVPSSMYSEIAAAARWQGALVVLDGYKDVDGLVPLVDVIKINEDELCKLVKSLNLNARSSSVSDQAAQLLQNYKKLQCVAITNGAKPASLFIRGSPSYFEFELPILAKVVNPIGAGDTVTAVFTHLLCDKRSHGETLTTEDIVKAFAWALGAGSASCRVLAGAEFTLSDMCSIREEITVEEIALRPSSKSLL